MAGAAARPRGRQARIAGLDAATGSLQARLTADYQRVTNHPARLKALVETQPRFLHRECARAAMGSPTPAHSAPSSIASAKGSNSSAATAGRPARRLRIRSLILGERRHDGFHNDHSSRSSSWPSRGFLLPISCLFRRCGSRRRLQAPSHHWGEERVAASMPPGWMHIKAPVTINVHRKQLRRN
jgi:hypothetical protein